MSFPFCKYSKIKDKYCICYYGGCDEYITLLKYLKPFIEEQFQGISLFISCKDNLYNNEDYIVPQSMFTDSKKEFGYVRELLCDMRNHPIELLIKESDIKIPKRYTSETTTNHCVVIGNGIHPTKPMTENEINLVVKNYTSKGWDIGNNLKGAGLVVGVESVGLYEAAINGVKINIVPNGIGTNFFQSLFPETEILQI